MAVSKRDVVKLPHHTQLQFCTTRAVYRQGKKLTSVKVYTVNNESQHLLVCGVPALGLQDELKRLCSRFGDVKSIVFIPQYEFEEFTETYHVQYTRIQSARYAKRNLDCRSFYGGVLHVCYAPEMECIEETRAKLGQRRKEIAIRTRGMKRSITDDPVRADIKQPQLSRSKKHPAIPVTDERLMNAHVQDFNCIWRGIPTDIDPRTKLKPAPELLQPVGPQKPDDRWLKAGLKEVKLLSEETVNNKVYRTPQASTLYSRPTLPKLIPRQVKVKGKIVFRNKSVTSEEKSTSISLGDKNDSLETIQAVRAKIRSASIPSVQLLKTRKEQHETLFPTLSVCKSATNQISDV